MISGARTRSGVAWRGSSDPPPRLEEICSFARLGEIVPAWERLAGAVDHPAAFLRPAWLLPWLATFGSELSTRFIAAWIGDELVGLFPFHGRREVACLQNDHTPEGELLVHPGHRASVLSALLDWITQAGSGVAALHLERVPAGSPNLQVLDVLLREKRFFLHESSYWQSRHTQVKGSFEEFAKSRSKNFRKQVKRALRAQGERGLRVETISEHGALERTLAELTSVSGASWQGKSGNGAFASDAGFYREITTRFANGDALRLFVCREGERCIGYVLCVVEQGGLEALKSEFDETLGDHMIGWQIYRAMYEHADRHGLSDINSGSWVTEFKDRWATHEVELVSVSLYPPTFAGSLRFLPHLGKEIVKRVAGRPTVTRCYPLFDEVPEGRRRSTIPPAIADDD